MSTSPTSPPDACQLPTSRDLDRLACAVRTAAQDRDLPERVVDWYEAWIFLFVAWCLTAPPHCVHRDRINDFWWALTDHPGASRWKVCQAMDALSMLFGALDGTDLLSFPETSSPEEALDDGPKQPSRYLPDGQLPEDVDPRAEVPTSDARSGPHDGGHGPATDEAAPSASDRETSPKTLFNPTGTSLVSNESAEGRRKSSSRGEAGGEGEGADAVDTVRTEELVSVAVPRAAAKRLRAAAERLGLPEPLLVARAIDLLRDRIGDVEAVNGGENGPLRRYQAQVDLLHRHGTADLPNPRADDREAGSGRSSPPTEQPGYGASVRLGTARGDGWAGEVPVLEIRDD